jgi:AcrR family transcriptional regulator
MVSKNSASASKSAPRPGGRSARIRESVFAATIELLPEQGIGNLSIRDVAERAEVAESTIYRRWGTATVLAAEAVADYAFTENPIPDTGNLEDDLRQFLRNIVAILRQTEMRRLLRIAISLDDSDTQQAAAYTAFWNSRFDAGTTIVQRAIARAEVPPGTDSLPVIETLVGAVYARTFLLKQPIDNQLFEASIHAALHVATR